MSDELQDSLGTVNRPRQILVGEHALKFEQSWDPWHLVFRVMYSTSMTIGDFVEYRLMRPDGIEAEAIHKLLLASDDRQVRARVARRADQDPVLRSDGE